MQDTQDTTSVALGDRVYAAEDVIKFMRFSEEWEKNQGAFLRREALILLAEKKVLQLSDEELQTGVDAWRKLRNRLVHEYFQETASFAQAIQQALHATPLLLKLPKAIRQRAQHVQVPV